MPADWIWVSLIVIVIVGLLALNYWANCRRAQKVLAYWAKMNNVRIIDQELRHIRRGPFTISLRDGIMAFRVTAEMSPGNIRSGWVACNISKSGRAAGRVQVKWDALGGFPVVMAEPVDPLPNQSNDSAMRESDDARDPK